MLIEPRAVAAAALAVVSLAACSTSGSSAAAVSLAPGTSLFAAPPALADCARVDVESLHSLGAADFGAPEPILTYNDPAQRSQTWTGCVGRRPDAAAADGAAAGSGGGAGSPTAEGSTGGLAWLVRYATSAAAARPDPFANPVAGDREYRTLVRAAHVGDASARVELAVHADDHATLVMVSVFDPRTRRNAAECGVVQVPGDRADAAVTWCLRTIAGLLVRGSAKAPAPRSTRPPTPSPTRSV